MPVEIRKKTVDRTHFYFENNAPTQVDTETGIIKPDLSLAKNISEVKAGLLKPFTNEAGETMPWLVAFMEAVRIVFRERNFSEVKDIDGRNDYCDYYARTMLQDLGLSSSTLNWITQ